MCPNHIDMLIWAQGNLCRERHKVALMRQQKLHSQLSVARFLEQKTFSEWRKEKWHRIYMILMM